MQVPEAPKIYHITHVDNLSSIIAAGRLYSDAEMIQQALDHSKIGMEKLKTGRFNRPVSCHPGTVVAEYVPFYFCPRSPMLYIASRQNHTEMVYRGGQDAIVHLEADYHRMVEAAERAQVRWAISLSNAAARYSEFRTGPDILTELDWSCINAADWASPNIREKKQAECLFHTRFPWRGITRLGVRTRTVHQRVETILKHADHRPPVEIQPRWYY